MEKLFRVLTEIADEEPQVAGQPGQVVVQLRVGEKFARRGGVVVQLGSGVRKIVAGVTHFIVKSVVGGEFAEGPLPCPNVANHAVGVADGFLRLIVEGRIVEQLAEGAFLRADIRP